MTALLRESNRALDALEAIDPDRLSDGDLHVLVVGLEELKSRAAVVRARLVSAWDARRVWAADGSKAGWGRLARECHLSEAGAKRELGRAKKLRTMPATVVALHEGKLSIDQADLLRGANQPALAELFAEAETLLIGEIAPMRVDDARRVVNYWIDAAYAQLGQDRPYRSRDGRYLNAVRTFHGHVDARAHLDPLAGTEVLEELHRIEHQLFEADWAQAREEFGPDALPSQLPRTHYQRMADAWQQMARNSAAYRDGTHRQPRPLITIHVGEGTFHKMCELADGTVVAPQQVVPYLCEGDIERIIFDSPSRVIDVGVRQRFFTGALRRAIEVRDRHCQHASGCNTPAEDCQIDHIVEYANGGLTTQNNGRCYCKTHNLARNNHPDEPEERPPP